MSYTGTVHVHGETPTDVARSVETLLRHAREHGFDAEAGPVLNGRAPGPVRGELQPLQRGPSGLAGVTDQPDDPTTVLDAVKGDR